MKEKIAFFANSDFYLFNFRVNLMKRLKKEGFEVFAIAPITNDYFPDQLEKNGIIFLETPLKRGWGSFLSNFKYFWQVFKISRQYHFFIAHNHTIKVNLLASLAQKLAGVPLIVCSIVGRGYLSQGKSWLAKIGQILVNFGYRFIASFVKKFIFLNEEDRDYFLKKKIIPSFKAELIASSGVDTRYFSPSKVDFSLVEKLKKEIDGEGKLVLTLIARLLWQKGVGDFAKLAEKLKKKYPQLIFLLVGPFDQENPDGVPEEKIKEWQNQGLIKYLGERREIREILYLTDIFVFPSTYGEGVPKVLLEAGAMEKPLVAYDNVGCREVINNGVNGFLVEKNNLLKLEEAVERLILDADLKKEFGRKAREKIEKDFAEEKVIEKTYELYQKLLSNKQ